MINRQWRFGIPRSPFSCPFFWTICRIYTPRPFFPSTLSPGARLSGHRQNSSARAHPRCNGSARVSHGHTTSIPNARKTGCYLLFLVLGSLLVVLGTTIISVAIPRISTEFKALVDVAWYGLAYLMTLTALQPTMGNVYKVFHSKSAYVISILVFEGQNWRPFEHISNSSNTLAINTKPRLSSTVTRPPLFLAYEWVKCSEDYADLELQSDLQSAQLPQPPLFSSLAEPLRALELHVLYTEPLRQSLT